MKPTNCEGQIVEAQREKLPKLNPRPHPRDVIYHEVYRGLLREGVPERIAKDRACDAVDAYKKNRCKPYDCITNAIKESKKLNRKSNKKK